MPALLRITQLFGYLNMKCKPPEIVLVLTVSGTIKPVLSHVCMPNLSGIYTKRALGVCRRSIDRTYEKLNDKEIPVYYSWLPDYERWVAPEYSKHLEKIILIRNQYVNDETGSIFCRSAGLTEPDLNSPCQQLDLELKNDSITYIRLYEAWYGI